MSTPISTPISRSISRLATRAQSIPRRLLLSAMRRPWARRAVPHFVEMPFDPFDTSFRENPYPHFHRLRERQPVCRTPFGIWILTRYADAVALLTDARFQHPDRRAASGRNGSPAGFDLLRTSFLAQNPSDHTRLRQFVGGVFTPAFVESLRPRIEAELHRILEGFSASGEADIIERFALPLPVAVVSEVFGIPHDEGHRCQKFVRQIAYGSDLFPSPAALARAESAASQLEHAFRGLIRERRDRPGADLVSRLLQMRDQLGDTHPVSDDELLATCMLLFTAGHETTVAFLGTAIRTLLSHPHLSEELRSNPGIGPAVVDELLRYEPPVQVFGREAPNDVEFRGHLVGRGQGVFVAAAAVNRDPERFPDPDRVDFHRPDNTRHFAFGHGIHACIGQGLARMQAEIALTALFRRLPRLRLGEAPPVWRDVFILRALDALPVAW